GPSLLAELETTLGAQLGIVPLPAGPAGDAAPLLTASGFFVHRQASERQARLAMEFATYATNVDSQTLWMQATDLIPANTSVEVADTPSRIVFVEQARTARVMPNDPAMRTLLAVGDVAYHAVLDEGVEPETAVQRMFAALQAATEGNGPDDDG
ncbi:MAG: extracellular solute-binding protein, partial [Caldilineaceae bacterium]|nr:extracellular solute-binding protein [Caldilineaceae bacterium]